MAVGEGVPVGVSVAVLEEEAKRGVSEPVGVGVPVGDTVTVLEGVDVDEALSAVLVGVGLAESDGVAKREGEAENTHTGFRTADTTTSTP